ncbi:acetate--CoA ligase family protein [Thalassobaculum sp. OXR-137]|uniref:acetate--CoA ligase family protein n=1 Tax=Thalassobaculum sp. OXR-137 TaxID=3100173 RepID=UPI002AC978CD|nr:acetate--CoA ligase family protein [Thalassobaculum sp. OXR-137]WPZ34233.1 acetate--CoA ligase family protein [Thalassobaculum sp. OXR-137]
MTKDRPDVSTLTPLIAPRSIAVIGASDDPKRIGGRPLGYMIRGGFSGPIWPVNPKRDTVQGLQAYTDVAALPGTPDAAIVAVPAPMVADTLEALADKGCKGAVVFSSGFAEMGEEGAKLQDRVRSVARAGGIRVLGPNCLGIFNARCNWLATFSSSVDHLLPKPGPVSIASQSGAYGSHVFHLMRQKGVETGIWITTGNEADVDVADAIAYLAADEETKAIVAYAEGIRDGDATRAALESAAKAGKPVIFQKVGRSEIGAAAAASHTAALAGSDRVYDALFAQYGVMRVDTTDQMLDAAYICSRGAYPNGNAVGLMTISGGVGVQMADAAIDYGLDVKEMPADTQKALKELLPFAAVRNPVDITAQAFNDLSLITTNMRMMLDEGGYDVVVAFFTMIAASRYIADDLIKTLQETRERFPDKSIILSLIAPPEIVRHYEEGGYPVFEDPTRAVAAAAVISRFGRFFARPQEAAPPAAPSGAQAVPARQLGEHEASDLLESWGVPFVPRRLATSAHEAEEAVKALGGKAVLKIASADILHKTEVGGVIVGVTQSNAAAAYDGLVTRVAQAAPKAKIDGVLVAAMAPEGVETVIGVQNDPTFGPVVMVGLGGILVEVLEDVSFRLAPFGVEEAKRMIAELKGAKIYGGVRGAPPADVDALAELLAKVSVFAASEGARIESVDLNPVRVLPKGEGCVALDALIVPR